MTGMVGNKRSIGSLSPMDMISIAVCLTTYNGGPDDFMRTPLEEADQVDCSRHLARKRRLTSPSSRNRKNPPLDGKKHGGRKNRGPHVATDPAIAKVESMMTSLSAHVG